MSNFEAILELSAEVAKPFEGLRLKPYHDPVGFPTIGYGHLLSRVRWEDLSKYPPITLEEAEELLERDMKSSVLSAVRLCPGATTVEQLAALADFTFNCGAGNLQISTLRKKVNRGDHAGAAEEFAKWVFAAGVKLPGLVRRRKAERALFESAR